MNVDMTKSYAFTFCGTDGGITIAVEKSQYTAECFSTKLETEYRSRIGFETWGDNKVDIKVDNKVGNNTRGDIKVDNNVVDDSVKHPQTRTRSTTPYNTRTRFVQHSYKKRRCLLDEVIRGCVVKHAPLTNSFRAKVQEAFVTAYDFVAPRHGMGFLDEQRRNG